MQNKTPGFISIIIGLIILLITHSQSNAWDPDKTHNLITEYAVKQSILSKEHGDYLKNLGFAENYETYFNLASTNLTEHKTVLEWLSTVGAKLEDGNFRELNHFFNPLKDWQEAGLWEVNKKWESAIVWAQDSDKQAAWNKPVGAAEEHPLMVWDFADNISLTDWSWQKTRRYFYEALTSNNEVDHQANYAKMFRGLGQQMHLLQDMSVPAHVRNDSHLINRWIEEWAVNNIPSRDDLLMVAPKPFISTVSYTSTQGTLAPSPIANLFDTNQYNYGSDPEITRNNKIGLAEYTNANFVSAGTIYSASNGLLPYPNVSMSPDSSVSVTTLYVPEYSVFRQYYWKQRHGDVGYVLAGVGYLPIYAEDNNIVMGPINIPPMDSIVHKSQAEKLLPRAVGYSAALLNYFFRGTMALSLPDNGVYAISTGGSFSIIRVKVRNSTVNNEPITNGTIQVVVKYKVAQSDPFQGVYVPSTSDYFYSISQPQPIASVQTTATEMSFNVSPAIPLAATNVYLQLVFKGKIGDEVDAVAVGFKDISEPTPIAIINGTDYICLNGIYAKAGSEEAMKLINLEIASYIDIYPHNMTNAYLAFYPSGHTPPTASVTNMSAHFDLIAPAKYGQVFVLSDYAFRGLSVGSVWGKIDAKDNKHTNPWTKNDSWEFHGLKNQDDIENGNTIHRFPTMLQVRGIKVFNGSYYEEREYPLGAKCKESNIADALTGPVQVIIP